MSPLRMLGSTSGYAELAPSAVAGDQTFTLPGTGGTLDRLNRAGNVLQVVNATYGTQTSNSTSTYADTGLAASITPSSSSSKILVLVNQVGCSKLTGNVNTGVNLKLFRGATELAFFGYAMGYTGTSSELDSISSSINYLDSPSTTSSVTYKTQFANYANAVAVRVQDGSSVSTITLLEIAA